MSTIGYARVSTQDQSLDIQLESLRHCDKIFSERISGSKQERPELQAMLGYIREGDAVEVTRLDRLARDARHLLQIVDFLESKKVALKVQNIALDTGTATGKLMLTMLAAVSAFERELLLERQAEGIAKLKAEGGYTGRKPTAMAKAKQVQELLTQGFSKTEVAKRTGISIPSVYRIIGKSQADSK